MANLTLSELFKRSDRIPTFAEKVWEQSFFVTADKKHFYVNEIIVTDKKNATHKFSEKNKKDKDNFLKAVSLRFNIKDIRISGSFDTYHPSPKVTLSVGKLAKTSEFGGQFGKESSPLSAENSYLQKAQKHLQDLIEKENGPIRFGDRYVSGIVKVPGTPKADFALIDELGNPFFWISHKAGSSYRDFQQWSGMSHLAWTKTVQQFVKDLENIYPNKVFPPKTSVARKMINTDFVLFKSVFGKEFNFGKTKYGKSHCQCVIVGDILFQKEGSIYRISPRCIMIANPNWEKQSPYLLNDQNWRPALMAIYKGDRSDFGFKGARFSIYPAGGRTVTAWI
jgi:hypothetical protein